jgi:enediyne biosynthesis protein E4
MRTRGVKLVLGVVALVATAAAGVVGERAYAAWRRNTEIAQARQEMASGLVNLARDRLTKLLAGRSSNDAEALLELAHCEMMRGRRDAALAAWERVPADSPLAAQAALERGSVLTQSGRFQQAEDVLRPFTSRPSPQLADVRHALLTVLVQEGRQSDARGLIEAQWNALGRALPDSRAERMALLREHIALDYESADLEGNMAKILDHDPPGADQARMRLAKAHLAVRAGRLSQAKEWLDASLQMQGDDPVAWRAMLDWAVAASDPAVARATLSHLPADGFTTAERAALRAWFAGRRGDDAAEVRELEDLTAIEPNRPAAWARLIELARKRGDVDASTRLQKRKAELDAAQDAYLRLHKRDAMSEDLRAFARLATTLGRGFEARGFCDLILAQAPNDDEVHAMRATLPEPPASVESRGKSLADALALKEAPTTSPPSKTLTVGAVPTFVDDAEAAGLAGLVFDNGHTPIWQLPEMSSGGIGLIDYDGDGWLDVYAPQGGRFPPAAGSSPGDRLLHNKGDGTFEDVTETSGLASFPRGYSHAVAVGDYDGDARPDLFVTRWRSYALYRNKGDGTFEDVTEASGLSGDRDWPTSAAFADLDNDGDLDLYVCHYGAWDADHPTLCKDPSNTFHASCDPRTVSATPDHLFRNDGGRFTDVSTEAGIVDREGRGLGVVAADFDDDGLVDLAVANDGTANYLFRNKGNLRFEEVGLESGFAASADGGYKAGMGIACGDLDGDGRIDLAVTNFYLESTTFYHNMGGGAFADHTSIVGLAAPSRWRLGFGVAFLDADADGRLDLLSANGHVSDLRPLFPHRMTAQLLVGVDGGKLADVTDQAGEPFQRPLLGRGLAVGDLDNDGRLDALVVSQNDPLIYLHNRTRAEHGRFVVFRLEGTRSNRDAVGARVTIRSGGRVQVAERFGGGSFASAGDPRIHFGLGERTTVESVEVRWPSGGVDRFGPLDANTGYLLREGEKTARPLEGFGPRPPRDDGITITK